MRFDTHCPKKLRDSLEVGETGRFGALRPATCPATPLGLKRRHWRATAQARVPVLLWARRDCHPTLQNRRADDEIYAVGGLGGCTDVLQKFDGTSWTRLADLPFESGSGACGYRDGEVRLLSFCLSLLALASCL